MSKTDDPHTAETHERSDTQIEEPTFKELGLGPDLLQALDDVGYETPSPIQARTIPLLLNGRDVLGQAQTGTGKTAAFALPLLNSIDLHETRKPQLFVLTPTRELAIQVAEAFQSYAKHLPGFHVVPVYGGQDYSVQLRALKRGVHCVVGTPGRVMDHMRRGTLALDSLKALVLDEADEMLRMGFIDDVEWILEHTPQTRQIALFSATMPKQIRRIATKYLNNPEQITIQVKTTTAETIRQRYWLVKGTHKLDALTRILEAEETDATIIFVRTKTMAVELSDKLQARGYISAPLSGDITQARRERTISQLKSGEVDIVVATDVAARGLDVERISHVINFDIPYDTEAYVHRIGRTGRAGRQGDAILFVAPRERRMLSQIEKATKKKIEQMQLPTTAAINEKRIEQFLAKIDDTIGLQDSDENGVSSDKTEEDWLFEDLLTKYQREKNIDPMRMVFALAKIAQGDTPFLLSKKTQNQDAAFGQQDSKEGRKDKKRRERPKREYNHDESPPEEGLERYQIAVGRSHGAKPGSIVGAIANEAELDSQYIGRINIYDEHSTVDLPEDMPKEILKHLKKVWVAQQQLRMRKLQPEDYSGGGKKPKSRSKADAHTGPRRPRREKPKKEGNRAQRRAEKARAAGRPKSSDRDES